jgi:thiamine biosynthesis lipoprotein
VMGMPVAIEVLDDIQPSALTEVFARLRRVDATFSTYRRDSQISQLYRGTLEPGAAHADVREVLTCCEAHRVATGGFFDIRAAGRLDPSGFVKGWAVERAAAILERAGARRFCINAGGDVLVRGGRPWRIGIRHPWLRHRLAGVVALSDGAVATSGAYERGPHVVDPHTGRPPRHVLSVTVLGPDLGTADAYSTAAFAMGGEGPAWTGSLSRRGFEAMTTACSQLGVFSSAARAGRCRRASVKPRWLTGVTGGRGRVRAERLQQQRRRLDTASFHALHFCHRMGEKDDARA